MDDVLIVGGGASGMALALCLRANGIVAPVIDARPAGAARRDARVLALSDGSRVLLEQLGVWHAIPSTPIRTIHISQQAGFGRTLLNAEDFALPALGHVVSAADLCAAMHDELMRLAHPIHDQTRVDDVRVAPDTLTLHAQGADQPGVERQARLLIRAEGTSDDPALYRTREYGQHAVVTTAYTDEPQRNVAWERFTPDGPLALLPFGQGYAVVCTAPAERAADLAAADDATFLAHLQRQFGNRLHFKRVEARAAFPLGLRLRRDIVGPRQAWVGNAAQTLHPVAGQGFNLGLRDAWELARALREAPDPGAPDLLARYARGRQPDRIGASVFTDALIQVFSNANPLLRMARGAGLALLDAVPPARNFVARRMLYGARAWP